MTRYSQAPSSAFAVTGSMEPPNVVRTSGGSGPCAGTRRKRTVAGLGATSRSGPGPGRIFASATASPSSSTVAPYSSGARPSTRKPPCASVVPLFSSRPSGRFRSTCTSAPSTGFPSSSTTVPSRVEREKRSTTISSGPSGRGSQGISRSAKPGHLTEREYRPPGSGGIRNTPGETSSRRSMEDSIQKDATSSRDTFAPWAGEPSGVRTRTVDGSDRTRRSSIGIRRSSGSFGLKKSTSDRSPSPPEAKMRTNSPPSLSPGSSKEPSASTVAFRPWSQARPYPTSSSIPSKMKGLGSPW